MKSSKNIEEIGRKFYDYSFLGRLIHYFVNIHNPDAVFIWIPKNAGTTIYNMLRKNGCLKAKRLSRAKYTFSQKGLVTFGHMKYSQLVEEQYVKPSFDENAFKFCFHRNPYDRAISLYEYLKPSLKKEITFLQFLRHINKHGVKEIGLYNGKELSHSNPQVRWIEDVDIDFYGRFDNLENDLRELFGILNLTPFGLPLPHKNPSKRKIVNDYYCQESKKLVESIYEEDFDFFKYSRKLPVD